MTNTPAYDPDHDALLSYNAAVQAVGEQVKAGAPVPEFFLPDRLRGGRHG